MTIACDELLQNGVRCYASKILKVRIDFIGQQIEPEVGYWVSADDVDSKLPVGVLYPRIPLAHFGEHFETDLETAVNTFMASQQETLEGAQTRCYNLIDQAAGAARSKYVTVASAQDSTYVMKYQQAKAYVAAEYPEDTSQYYWLVAEATATGKTVKEVADGIKKNGDAWAETVGPSIEAVRIAAKANIAAATTVDDVLNIMRKALIDLAAI